MNTEPALLSSTERTTPTTPWLRWTFCAWVLAIAVYHFAENTTDPDLWGHVIFGQHLIQTGALPGAEPYSWTAQGHPWVNHEVLSEVSLGAAHLWLGGPGLLLLKLCLGLLTFGIALRTGLQRLIPSNPLLPASEPHQISPARSSPPSDPPCPRTSAAGGGEGERASECRDILSWPARGAAWIVGAVAVVEISYGFAARPQIFTALGLAVLLWLLRGIHRGQWRWAIALPVLFCLWINTHGGALAGMAVLGLAAAMTSAQWLWNRTRTPAPNDSPQIAFTPESVVALWLAVTVSFVALLLNPWGTELIRWLIGSVLWLRPEIEEWNPARLSLEHAPFFILLLLAAGSFVFSRKPKSWWEVAVCAALAFMAIRSIRHTPLFSIAAMALIPEHLADAAGRLRPHFARSAALFQPANRRAAIAAILAVSTLGILAATMTLHKERAWTMEVPRQQYPVAAIEFMRAHELRGNLLVFFDWGEMALWELPECPVSLDGRLDTCYPRELIAAHWKFYNGEPFDPKVLDVSRADLALLPSNLAGAMELAKHPDWRAVYYDDLAVVLVRDAGRFPQLIAGDPRKGPAEAVSGRAPFPNEAARGKAGVRPVTD